MQKMNNIQFLMEKPEIGKKFGVENIKKVLESLGNPQNQYKTIHVAGSNGKGSVCAMVAKGLELVGFKTGLYTSPHLDMINERVKINNKDISDQALDDAIGKIRQTAEANNISLTYFEYLTAAAFVSFAEQQVDYAVIEVGLGGRFDATNVIHPEVCAITNISLEHVQFLGNTIGSIACEKAEIIKEGNVCFTKACRDALDMILCKCRAVKARMAIPPNVTYPSRLKGSFQADNIAIAAGILDYLGVDEKIIKKALIEVEWPGRFEHIQERLILDGAHNPAGVAAIMKDVEKIPRNKLIIVFGVMQDKDINEMTGFIKHADEIILTKPDMERSADPDTVSKLFVRSEVRGNVEEAVKYAQSIASEKDLILVTGSIFTVAEARRFLRN